MSETEERVIEAIEDMEKPQDNTITFSNGIVLRGKKANPLALITVMANFPRPKPPMWKHPQMGRMMENPDDPEYQDSLKAWEAESSSAMLNAMIALGTEVVKIPKGFPGPNEDEWLEDLQLLGIPTNPSSKKWRYLYWVLFAVCQDENDMFKIRDLVGRLSGVPERAVDSAVQFPGSE